MNLKHSQFGSCPRYKDETTWPSLRPLPGHASDLLFPSRAALEVFRVEMVTEEGQGVGTEKLSLPPYLRKRDKTVPVGCLEIVPTALYASKAPPAPFWPSSD